MRFAAILGLLFAMVGCASNPVSEMRRVAVHLTMSDGSCSGTVVGKQLILTAAHCMDGYGSMLVDGLKVNIYKIYDDKHDHVLVLTDHVFASSAERKSGFETISISATPERLRST